MSEKQTLTDALAQLKIGILPQFNVGMLRGTGKEASQWLIAKEFSVDGLVIQLCWYGDWREGKKHFWQSHANASLTPDARKQVEAEIKARQEEFEKETSERHEAVSKEAEELWASGASQGDHPYITRKKLSGLNGARIFIQEKGHPVLLVPMRDVEGKLWNLTRIFSKKFEGTNSDKFIMKGGRKLGLFHLLGEICEKSTVYFTEGYATGASVYQALGNQPVVICFDAGNLLSVSQALRAKFPDAKFIFAADNDQWTKGPNGAPYNTGKEKALEAASVTRGSVILPRFTEKQLDSKPTDWSDIHCLAGIAEVSEQLTNPNKQVQEVVPLMPRGKGKAARISEKDICTSVLEYFEGRLIRFEQDLFLYKDNFWNLLGMNERDKIKQLIGRLNPEAGSRDIEAAFRYLMIYTPTPPVGVNLFQPTPFAANFENGTLHVYRKGQSYEADFRPHSKEDYLTAKLPFDFPGIPGTPAYQGKVNDEFRAMLGRVWEGDEDLADKIRLYKQVLGACLIPMFPIIVMFVGPTRTGKSTLLKLMAKLVSFENVSNVDPSDFKEFGMETMIGKLLNINTDIDLVAPMSDAMMKKFIDRVPIEVKRKFLKAAKAFLPAVQAYAANDLPKTLDGQSRAYKSRMIIIKTDKFQPAPKHDLEFDQWVWEQGPEGIICDAVEGLFDLLQSGGHYHRPESGAKLVEEMQDRNDPVATFLEAVKSGTIADENTVVRCGEEQRMERARVWRVFSNWKLDEERSVRDMGRTTFFRLLEMKGFKITKVQGVHFVHGLGTEEQIGSEF